MPKPRNDKSQNPNALTMHMPRMADGSKKVGVICAQVLGDYTIKDLRSEVTNLRGILDHQHDFIEELLKHKIGRPGVVAPTYVCNLCYKVDRLQRDRSCPCGFVCYCSTGCQELDWNRSHKDTCPFATRGIHAPRPPPPLVNNPGNQHIIEIE